jgi:glucose dehydrogenase
MEAQPLVKDGVIFITDHQKTVAIDGLTGKEIWKAVIEYPPETTRVERCVRRARAGQRDRDKFPSAFRSCARATPI